VLNSSSNEISVTIVPWSQRIRVSYCSEIWLQDTEIGYKS